MMNSTHVRVYQKGRFQCKTDRSWWKRTKWIELHARRLNESSHSRTHQWTGWLRFHTDEYCSHAHCKWLRLTSDTRIHLIDKVLTLTKPPATVISSVAQKPVARTSLFLAAATRIALNTQQLSNASKIQIIFQDMAEAERWKTSLYHILYGDSISLAP